MKFKNPYRFTQIDKQYSFAGNTEDFYNAVSYCKGVLIRKINEHQCEITSDIALGVLMSQGNPSFTDPISVTINITEGKESGSKLHFSTAIRQEHYFITLIFIIILGNILNDEFSLFRLSGMVILGFITQLWFYNVLRAQEMAIIEDVLKKLKIFELHFI